MQVSNEFSTTHERTIDMSALTNIIERDVALPVRDGTLLRCDVYRAAEDSPRPAVLFRTPYDKGTAPLGTLSPQQCLDGDFVAMVQDTRVRYASEGEWEALSWGHEGPDGFDSSQWLSEQPSATSPAWRNGWCHTGDRFRQYGTSYVFVDCNKDAIRRRGANISSTEIEAQATSFPGIAAAAAVGVPCPDGEELDEPSLCRRLASRLAHFMVPRYILRLETLLLTPTGKIRKDHLGSGVLQEKVWGREVHSLRFRAAVYR